MIMTELSILATLSYITYGQASIFPSLMFVPIAFGGVLVAGRLSAFIPSFAFLSLAIVEFKVSVNQLSINTEGLYVAGILGAEFFVISYLFQFYSKKLMHNEKRVSILEKLRKAEEYANRTQNELKATNKKLEMLLKSAGEGVLGLDHSGKVNFANPCASQLLGLQPDELTLMNIRDFLVFTHFNTDITSERQKNNYAKLREVFDFSPSDIFLPDQWRNHAGQNFYVEYSCEELEDGEGVVVVFQNITTRKHNEDLLVHLANFDGLTDIPNRQFFLSTLKRTLKVSSRSNEKLAVFFLDLDHFKFINDNLGHDCGDQLLITIAQRLSSCIRSSDLVARLGGDEFAIMLPNIGKAQYAKNIAQTILDSIYQPICLNDNTLNITSSIGISIFPDDSKEAETLLKDADTAMYSAKKQGRGMFQCFRDQMQQEMDNRKRIQILIHQGLQNQEFHLAFQPIVDITSGKIVSLEVLIRWHTSQGENIGPDVFIPIAEDSGKIREIGIWVLEATLKQISVWKNILPYMPTMAINVSSKQLTNSDFRQKLCERLNYYHISPREIELELTETSVMENPEFCLSELRSLNNMGIRVSIDDFGTGYSSLEYLRRLPLDNLKIDQCFTRGIGADQHDESLIKLMVSMAKTLELEVIAEGVETAHQLAFLEELGCEKAQGYFMSKPCLAENVEALFEQQLLKQSPKNNVTAIVINP